MKNEPYKNLYEMWRIDVYQDIYVFIWGVTYGDGSCGALYVHACAMGVVIVCELEFFLSLTQ